jgi:hypothetical protein
MRNIRLPILRNLSMRYAFGREQAAGSAMDLRIQSTKEVFGLQCVKIPG